MKTKLLRLKNFTIELLKDIRAWGILIALVTIILGVLGSAIWFMVWALSLGTVTI